jgi:hypothetical protein
MQSLVAFILLFLASARLMAGSAVVWSGQQDIKMGPGGSIDWIPSYGAWSIDLNSDGNVDISLGYITWFTVQTGTGASLVMTHPSPSVYDAPPLAAGTSIGATLANGTEWHSGSDTLVDWENIPGFGIFGAGAWAFVTNAYLGVSVTAADGVHYGWVQITSYPDMRAHIHSWAYESQPGVSIEAGVVPEPSTIALFIIGGIFILGVTLRFHSPKSKCQGKI